MGDFAIGNLTDDDLVSSAATRSVDSVMVNFRSLQELCIDG